MFFTKEGRKFLKSQQVSLIAIIFFVLPAGTLITFFPHLLLKVLPDNSIFLVLALFLMLSRQGRLRFNSNTEDIIPEFSTLRWLLYIIAIEVFSLLLFNSLLQISNAYLPDIFIEQGVKAVEPTSTISVLFLEWGLFPFSLYALIAVILAYAYFYKKQPGLLSAAIPPFKSVYTDKSVRLGVNIFCSKLTDIATAIVFIIAILQLNLLLLHAFNIDNTNNIRMGGVVCYAISSLVLVSPLYDDYVKFISRYSSRAYAFLIPFIVIVVALLIISALLGEWLYQQIADKLQDMEEFQRKIILQVYDWHLLYWAWWVCVAPLFSSMIARVSRGKSIRETIAATLFFPMIIAVLLTLSNTFTHDAAQWITALSHSRSLNLLAPWTIVIFLMTVKDGRYSIFGFMPYKKSYVTARPVKIKHLMKPLLQFTAFMIVAFLFANLRSIQLLAGLAAIPGILFFTLCVVGFYGLLVLERDKTKRAS